ncbi:16S rRNA (guanine(966)-N(2))-methyltransferase RsmD [Dokdonella sp.]|uniref:16S rRNA (guanine(966)-N(2))-methyltransferase RsmD n=1 Tax=Dokdonella sp. TaxID=2291710 RepID=UPI0025B8059E|nr:16S rRNA (guanine(966)-N(2))-methyltransferase RsmD [Dokdonella sp.]MBX3691926.1 16S rRNA (guanine(966)-N(2))-methyltransferase RsmD [Dokdonella sp.]MCW5568168.1 16S rRNA (guanine(966)-N(2))-methyltransferase RsmD [Dokdonella sp.]
MRSRSPKPAPARVGHLRIVAGELRGSRIEVVDAPGLRPTGDRVRETLFNWLAPVIAGSRCLDLYAGSGALGIEAISRGAAHCTFVERERALAKRIEDTLSRLRVADRARVVCADAQGWLGGEATPFDLVFLDPPFEADLWEGAARRLEEGGWLAPEAWIYIESPLALAPALPAAWHEHRVGQAGQVRYALHRRLPHDPLS